MTRGLRIAGLIALALAVLGGFVAYRHAPAGDPAEEDSSPAVAPVVPVKTAPAKRQAITVTITAYGRVVARDGAAQVVSLPFEAHVPKVYVAAGQSVAVGDPLVTIEPSPAAKLALRQAQNDLVTAKRLLAVTKRKLKEGLATNTELTQAEQAEQDARSRVTSLGSAGVGRGRHTLKASLAGVVSAVNVAPGTLVPPGGPLLSLALDERLEAVVGVPRSDVDHLKAGLAVPLTAIAGGKSASGKVRLVANRRDPTSGLVDVFVTLPEGAGFLLDDYVAADVALEAKSALVVPRQAVLPEEGGSVLYTVKDGHAHAHNVSLGLENDTLAEISGGGVKAGDVVVVVGNYELEDGMAVEPEKTP